MNSTTDGIAPGTVVHPTIPLLREYTQKLNDTVKEMRQLRLLSERDAEPKDSIHFAYETHPPFGLEKRGFAEKGIGE